MCIAVVHWSGSTARHTTSGEGLVSMSVLRLCLALAALSAVGCTMVGESTVPLPEVQESPMAGLLREREAQLAALRAQLAAAHIASAKQEAELTALREQVIQLRREGIESRQRMLELRHEVEEAQAREAAPRSEPGEMIVSQPATESAPDETAADWRPVVSVLMQEVKQLKEELDAVIRTPQDPPTEQTPKRESPSGEGLAESEGDHSANKGVTAASAAGSPKDIIKFSDQASNRIRVVSGDSLWSLARKHRTTVEQLRRANPHVSTWLHIGQMLVLPPSQSSPSDR